MTLKYPRSMTTGWGAALLAASLALAAAPGARADSDPSTTIPATTGSIINANSPVGPGTRYGRVIRLQYSGSAKGTLLATYESWPSAFALYQSTNDGASWTQISSPHETQFPGFSFNVEPHLFELPVAVGNLPAGTVLLAANAENGSAHQLEIYDSLDHGYTWQYRGMADNNGSTGKGLWEPNLNVSGGGQLVCYYSDERFQPTYNQLLGERVSPDGGLTWGAEQYACAISDGVQRPGMAVTAKLPNGTYVMSFEAIGQPGGQVHLKFSPDGINWGSGPSDYGTPVQNAQGAYPGQTPYVMWSPSGGPQGTLIVSGRALNNSPNTDRELFINTNLGQGNFVAIPSPVQWQGGNGSLAGWSMGMIPTADGQGVIQLASSAVSGGGNAQMLVGREPLLVPGKTFQLTNQNSNLDLTVPGNTNVHGTQLIQYSYTGATSQNWVFNDLGNELFTITNPTNGLAVDDYGWSKAPGAEIDQWDLNGAAVQQFWPMPTGTGYFRLRNVNSQEVIAVSGASQQNNAVITQWSDDGTPDHNWAPTQAGIPDGDYRIQSTTGYVLDGAGNSNADGTHLDIWNYWSGQNQKWHLHNLGNGYYSLRNVNTDGTATEGRSLDCTGASPNDNTQIEFWDWNGGPWQEWSFTSSGSNYIIATAQAKSNGQHDVLNAVNGGGLGANVVLYPQGQGSGVQTWTVIPVN